MKHTSPMLAHDADIAAYAEGRTPLRRGIPMGPVPRMATDANPTRPGGMPQLPLSNQEDAMDDTALNDKVDLLLQYLQPKLDPDEMGFVRTLFDRDGADLNAGLGMDAARRTAPLREKVTAKLAADRATGADRREKMFPNFNRLGSG